MKGYRGYPGIFVGKPVNGKFEFVECRADAEKRIDEKMKEKKKNRNYMFQIVTSSILLGVFIWSISNMLFTKPSKLEREIEAHGKAAQECLVERDTIGAIVEFSEGMKLVEGSKDYDLFRKHLYPIINQIYEGSFYDKRKGSLIHDQIQVHKGKGIIEYPRRYQHPWFPKEQKEKRIKEN